MANTAAHFKFADNIGNQFFHLVAGKSNKSYAIHKNLLFAQCGQLRTKLVPGLFGASQSIQLDADAETIALLIAFLYKSQIPVFNEDGSESSEPSYVKSRQTGPLIPVEAPSQAWLDTCRGETDINIDSAWVRKAFKEDEEKRLKKVRISVSRWNRKFVYVKGPDSAIQPDPESIEADDNINHYQTTLINLCILAEEIYWPNLFRAALISYLTGEPLIRRSMPISIVHLIYSKTVAGSKLREVVLDGLSIVDEKVDMDMSLYMEYAKENGEFMEDVFGKLKEKKKSEFEFESVLEAAEVGEYDMEEEDEMEMAVETVAPLLGGEARGSGASGVGGD